MFLSRHFIRFSKQILLGLAFPFLPFLPCWGQETTAKDDYTVSYRQLGPDSVVFYYEAGWHLVKPQCAVTYRYTRLTPDGFFTGAVKDLSRDSVVTFTGNYENRKKEGLFSGYHHRTGLPAFSGHYADNKRQGLWYYWYENGKPQITLRFSQDSLYVLEAWDRDGKQTVANGNGTVKIENFDIIEGKVKNGLMEGNWLYHRRDGYVYFQEKFKEGKFTKGTSPRDTYQDKTRFRFLQEPDQVLKGETFLFSPNCVVVKPRDKRAIKVPWYRGGNENLNKEIVAQIRNRPRSAEETLFTGIVNINFEVNTQGEVVNIHPSNSFGTPPPSLVEHLKKIVASTGKWQPALVDQQPSRYSMQLHVSFKENSFYAETRFFAPLEEGK